MCVKARSDPRCRVSEPEAPHRLDAVNWNEKGMSTTRCPFCAPTPTSTFQADGTEDCPLPSTTVLTEKMVGMRPLRRGGVGGPGLTGASRWAHRTPVRVMWRGWGSCRGPGSC